jgi:hypothetical protein
MGPTACLNGAVGKKIERRLPKASPYPSQSTDCKNTGSKQIENESKSKNVLILETVPASQTSLANLLCHSKHGDLKWLQE